VSRAVLVGAVLCLAAACGGSPSNVSRLDRLGFFDYTPPVQREAVKRELARSPVSGVFAAQTKRFRYADAEGLAEGGVGDVVRGLQPLLRRLGVPPLRVRDDFTESYYTVYVDERPHPIWTRAELAAEARKPGLTWGLSAARTAKLLNELLARAGSRERAWGYAGGNDFGIWILTPELRSEVARIVGRRDAPYRVTERYPSFGAP
jgi:hypothetical protein